MPNRILFDQGSAFAKTFVDMAANSSVKVDHTGVEAHWSLGLAERYHQPLRQTFRKIKIDQPNADRDLALHAAVKAMNDTLGPEGLVPSALVFGDYPKVTTRSENPSLKAELRSRAQMATVARKEMERLMANMKVKRALNHAVPGAADRSFQAGDRVLV